MGAALHAGIREAVETVRSPGEGGSWRMDETYVKARGEWVYLDRAVDNAGKTVEFGNEISTPAKRLWFSQTPKLLMNWGLPPFFRFPWSPFLGGPDCGFRGR